MIYFAIAIIVLVILLAIFKGLKFESGEEKLPYKLRQNFFNKSEEALFFELKKSLPPEYHIFPKTRIIDFIEPTNSDYKWRNKIWSRHVDFLVCNEYFKPIFAIELNGKSHLDPKRISSDHFKKQLFQDTNLLLEVVEVGDNFKNKLRIIETIIADGNLRSKSTDIGKN